MKRFVPFLLCLVATPAFAQGPVASLAQQEGTVLVNQGEVFATAEDGQALRAGDRVMVMEGGFANLVFGDGCEVVVPQGSLLDVPAASPCVTGEVAQIKQIGPNYAQAVGDAGPDVRHNRERDIDEGWIWFGVGMAALVAFLANEPDEEPVSP